MVCDDRCVCSGCVTCCYHEVMWITALKFSCNHVFVVKSGDLDTHSNVHCAWW